jgi:NADPH-dependent glutamate synthase beta subunit-like oxidoreductase/2,4-dienoyl-CoA reductase-like NADH-dependent reductase (Old Yellow Enzyme family)
MKYPILEPFHLETLDQLKREARRLNLTIPVSDNVSVLADPLVIGGVTIPNRLCVQPMECCDAGTGGVPGELTLRRYRRYAEGGFGLIWFEATAVDGECRSNPRQLWMNRRNVRAFADLVRDIKQAGRHRWGHEVIVLLQLSHAGQYASPEGVPDPLIACHEPGRDRRQGIPEDYPVLSDDYLDRIQDAYREAGSLAMEAGFDGIDVKGCHGDLPAELLAAFSRPRRYGGSFENRSRFLRETLEQMRKALPGALLASRISIPDGQEPAELACALQEAGAQILSISEASASQPVLEQIAHLMTVTRGIQQAVPSVVVVGGGVSWFRHFLPNVAAGFVREGYGAMVGVGRAALAYPSLADDILHRGGMDPDKCCMTCSACMQLVKDGGTSGCAVMDSEIYGAAYRSHRHFAVDNLREEAKRCLGCEPAPCRSACPARIDVPAFLKAFAEGDTRKAYEIIRKTNVLPEMCARLCPVGRLCEGRCVINTLEGTPIPIHDIQFSVAWEARYRGFAGVRLPEKETGKRIAVVGGGPAGVACAVTLLERGHQVVVFERAGRLGGTPEQLIRASRFSGARDEVDAVLKPALCEARLTVKYGCELGREITLEELRREHDAVFLAAGVWGERSLGSATGVVNGVAFLRQVRSGEIEAVPRRVIVLAGGDSAMDCAAVALERGALELTIVYEGALSEMHWHMPDSWFRTEGVQFMTKTRPKGYEVDSEGKVVGLKISMNLAEEPESVLAADLIIEAMGLGVEKALAAALSPCAFTDQGLVKTVGDDSLSCGCPGVYAGGGLINGGDSVVQCVSEGMKAGIEIADYLESA